MSLATTDAPSIPNDRPDLLTVEQAAKKLSVSKQTLRNLITSGQIPRVPIGSIIRIDPRDLEAFIEYRKLRT